MTYWLRVTEKTHIVFAVATLKTSDLNLKRIRGLFVLTTFSQTRCLDEKVKLCHLGGSDGLCKPFVSGMEFYSERLPPKFTVTP